MTDGPQLCALPGCSEIVEQPDDGGPRRLYCSPSHRAAARKARHAARMDAVAAQAAADVTQPIVQAPEDQPSERPTIELPAPLGVTREEAPEPEPLPEREWSPAAAGTVSPPALPAAPPATPSGRTVRTITSKRVKKAKPARTAAERRNAATAMRRRAIASVAIASLVAGGASYFVTNNVIPTGPTPLPPQAANDPSADADVWAGQAQVTLASLTSQLDAVNQAEASWLALPATRRAQEPAAVQALKDRKALLEQQRTTLMSQLEAFKALPDRTSELTSAQAQLDAVERTLSETTTTAASPDYQEALRQLESQRDIRRQQRDHAAQALTDLRTGVEQALSSPLPADKDETAPIVERVKAVVAGRPDPGEKKDDQEHNAADGQDPATTPRREDGGEERGDVGTTAPPDPERPNAPDILADGGSQGSNGGGANGANTNGGGQNGGNDNGGSKSEGPVRSVVGTLGSALGQGDSTNRDERKNRGNEGDDSTSSARSDRDDNGGNDRGGLGGVVRGVSGALLGGSSRDDDRDDDARGKRNEDRDDDGDDRHDRSSRSSDRDDRDDDKGRDRSDRDDDDRGGLRGIADGLLGGGHDRDDDDNDKGRDKADRDDDEDRDHKRPSGKREHKRDKDRESSSEHRHDKDDSDEDDSDDDEHADNDRDHKRPSGKREHKRDKDREDSSEHRKDKDDSDKDDSDKDDSDKDDSDKKDRGHKDKDDDGDHEDKDSDDGDDDGGKSHEKSDKGDDDGGDSDSGDSGGDDD